MSCFKSGRNFGRNFCPNRVNPVPVGFENSKSGAPLFALIVKREENRSEKPSKHMQERSTAGILSHEMPHARFAIYVDKFLRTFSIFVLITAPARLSQKLLAFSKLAFC